MRLTLVGAALAAAIALVPTMVPAAMTENPIIPRSVIFGNPERTLAKLSPDGKWISFLAPKDGVLNIWVAPAGAIDQAKPITDDKERPIREYFWSRDSNYVLYLQDKGGNENFLLFAADPKTGTVRNLTPYENTRALPLQVSVKHPGEILVGLNNRDPKWHDAWRINLATGKATLVYENKSEYGGFVADDEMNIRYGFKATADGGFAVERIGRDGKATPFTTIPGDDSLTTTINGFDTAGTTLYGLESRGRDKAALVTFDPTTAQATVIGESNKADVASTITHPTTGKVLAFSANYLKNTWVAIDQSVKPDLDYLNNNVKGDWELASQTDDDKTWLILVDPVTEPAYYATYNRTTHTVTKLFTIRPKLEGAPLSPMYAIAIKSRDGLELVSYLTLPRGSDANNDGKPDHPLPMVLNVHGGPWARDEFGYNATHQWLANRGYAVLSVNFRGSTGLGKNFTNAGDRQWGRKMHDDLIDAVEWAVRNGIAQREKVAIMGGSYGGYATLAGLTMTPKTFACGVDIVGPSNLQTLLSSIPPYWATFFENFAKRIGDPRTEDGKALLAERSPLTYADKIVRPLLIGQGANDPRVKQAESDQIVAAMKARNIKVTYVLYPDEGHGFARPTNRTSFYAVSEGFLSACIGGRFEPVGTDFRGSSIQVKEGIDNVAGLRAAMGTTQ